MHLIKVSTLVSVFCVLVLSGCQSDYSKLVTRELARGEAFNSLPFGMEMGAARQSFFDRCTQLNKEKKITQGKGGVFAEYRMIPSDSTRLADVIELQFYGLFKDEFLRGMDMRFSYSGWAPWNEKYQPTTLIKPLKDTLKNWFPGNDFMKIEMGENRPDAWVKVDGNRQIKMYVLNDSQVAVKIEDLLQKY